MDEAAEKRVAQEYRTKWLEYKHSLTAQYFSGSTLANTGKLYASADPPVEGVVGQAAKHPLKAFLETPRLPEDLARYLESDSPT
ncbi:hypothetical protein WJX72_010641 [[Myrmecia] bisecta]|uniref:Uncharacterized protein n=1 Tax=[Myrmecia] bisecta TaxID=41462 RepID=A0AAW1NYG9_9CHLO